MRTRVRVVQSIIAMLIVATAMASAQDKASDKRFRADYWTATGAAMAMTAGDAATTLTLIGPGKRCVAEGWSPWELGRQPRPARTIAMLAGEVTVAAAAGWILHRRGHGRWLWLAPLVYVAAIHGRGMVHNLENCR